MKINTNDIICTCSNSHELSLIILPTEHCNFRCKYCYEDHKIGTMKFETIQAILKLLKNRIPNLRYLSIEWFGGEPILEADTIIYINKHVVNFCKNLNPEIKFSSGITTNGYLLTDTLVKELYELNVDHYQVSLDGPEAIHNITRTTSRGYNTFSRIWKNLIDINELNLNIKVLLRIHLMNSNYSHIPELLSEIDQTFGTNSNFDIFLKPIENLGGRGADFTRHEVIIDQENAIDQLTRSSNSRFTLWRPGPVCHATKLNSFVIRPNGSVGKCTTALSDNINNIGKINYDGTLALDQNKIHVWSRGLSSLQESELYCPYNNIHATPET